MELRQLRQFVMLSETMNFRRAAERLNIAQPPLSISLRKLEEELGSSLFERTTREMRLTAFGHVFLKHARRTLFEADQALLAARAASKGEAGTLTIGFVGTATYAALPRIIPAYRAAYPQVQLQLRESTTSEIINRIEQGQMDLGIVRTPVVRPARAELTTIEQHRLVLALPQTHPFATRPVLSMTELKDQPFVSYSPTLVPSLYAVLLSACQAAGFTPIVAQEAVQVQTMISLVESGLGVALVPSIATRKTSDAVVFRNLPELAAMSPIALSIAHIPELETKIATNFLVLAEKAKAPADV